jgi:TM2 domain-containing membrane protein YozV
MSLIYRSHNLINDKERKEISMRNIAALFSMLMPGIGQFYNGQFLKGAFILIVEHYNNFFGNINKAIQLDFNGLHQQAIDVANFDFILFYPGFYAYAVWDAWFYAKPDAGKTKTAIPFLIGGFLGEFGAIYASKLAIPTLTVGLIMIIPMLCGMIIFRNQ